MNIDIQFRTPSGNIYGAAIPVEKLRAVLPLDFLADAAPVPDHVPEGDHAAYRAGMAAAVFVTQQEILAQRIASGWRPYPLTGKEANTLEAAQLQTDLNTPLNEFAAGIASHWRALVNFVEIGAEECAKIVAAGATPIYPVGPFGKIAVEICAERRVAHGAEYLALRNRGVSVQQIAEAIAEAICDLDGYFGDKLR